MSGLANGGHNAGADKRLELAYEAAHRILDMQDATLGNTRSRANNLLATSALLTSVAAGVGLLKTDPTKGATLPDAGAWTLLVLTVVLGGLVVYVLWPARVWHFGADPRVIYAMRDQMQDEDAIREFVVAN